MLKFRFRSLVSIAGKRRQGRGAGGSGGAPAPLAVAEETLERLRCARSRPPRLQRPVGARPERACVRGCVCAIRPRRKAAKVSIEYERELERPSREEAQQREW